MKYLIAVATFLPATVHAATFDRPIPQAQSATAEVWFGIASFALIAALVFVGRLVARK
jgi:hypothetical protein